jgi:hypothetical protein
MAVVRNTGRRGNAVPGTSYRDFTGVPCDD